MSYSSLVPVFQAQANFPVIPGPAAQPAPRGPPLPQLSPSAQAGPSSFKAPAHKHAHHLHSIPPREKSTRTLIIDHMLWVHARTRFAQARAELGMTDRTGGPSSPHFRFRERPEQYDEEDEVSSDGEDIDQLEARAAGHGDADNEDEDTRMQKQDFALARSLRLRAIALEKVVTSMLDQPPPLHAVPPIGDELQSPPRSPKRHEPQPVPKGSHPHTLPNGVRLRLALGAVINDLFARQAPIAPYRHHHHPPPIVVSNSRSEKELAESSSSNSSPVLQNPSPHPSSCTSQSSGGVISLLPPSLLVLASISGVSGTEPLPLPSIMAIPSVQGQRIVQPGNQAVWNDRIRTFYMEGADPSTANSPPALRCPRHLHTGCEICVEAKQLIKAPGGPTKGRAGAWGGETTSRPPQIGLGKSMGGSGSGISGWQDSSGIGSGLAHSGINGSVLRRKSKWFQQDTGDAGDASSGSGNTRLSELIPRFLRLSALVAMELGQELGDDELERESQGERSGGAPSASPQSSMHARKVQSENEASPLRPSRDWYMLLAGLLTRATLEGYLTGGWRGPAAAACLLSVGLGMSDDPSHSDEDEGDSTFEWFDPDDLPTLKEAARVVFPSLSAMTASGIQSRRESVEAEFEAEIKERLRRFYAIPALTPDLSTHMEDLAWHYPAEPVERAAVRFCEAVARWRGKPELETYKKTSKDPATPAMTIESLVHSNPTSPTSGVFPTQSSLPRSKRPPIEQYFIHPQSLTGRKRRRSTDDGDRFTKRVHGGMPVSVVSSNA